jgi:hypothetical protein
MKRTLAPALVAALSAALAPGLAGAEEQSAPEPEEPPATTAGPDDPGTAPAVPSPPPNQWILVVPAGSTVVVPGGGLVNPAPAPRPKYWSPEDPARLRRAMELEGPDFSLQRLTAYRRRMIVGGALAALGGVSVYCSLYVGIFLGSEVAAWVAGGGAFAALAVGLPLIVSGSLGRKRQLLLWRKDEIMSGPHWSAGILAVPGGAGLGATIVF